MNVKPILGTMTFGQQVDLQEVPKMMKHFALQGGTQIDTAFVYNDGESERFIGSALEELAPNKFTISTKVNPRVTGKLDRDSVRMQFFKSLKRLAIDAVDILYLHFPDPETDLEETLGAVDELHGEGFINRLGISNFAASDVINIVQICNDKDWLSPSVYQGLYNPLSRNVESELLPLLRDLSIPFFAYNPLAGGVLTGRYSDFSIEPEPGRFTYRPNYKERYWKAEYFDALRHISLACSENKLGVAEAAFRWMQHHSKLSGEGHDAVLIGASSLSQLSDNMNYLAGEGLPREVVDCFEIGWSLVKDQSPTYYRNA